MTCLMLGSSWCSGWQCFLLAIYLYRSLDLEGFGHLFDRLVLLPCGSALAPDASSGRGLGALSALSCCASKFDERSGLDVLNVCNYAAMSIVSNDFRVTFVFDVYMGVKSRGVTGQMSGRLDSRAK